MNKEKLSNPPKIYSNPVMTRLTDNNIDTRLKQFAIKNSNVSSNIKSYEIESFNNADNLITPGSELSLWKIMMDIRAKDGERFAVTIKRNW